MAIIKCKECGKDISNQARSCPHCGTTFKVTTPDWAKYTIVGVCIFFIVVILVRSLISTYSDDKSATASTTNAEVLEKSNSTLAIDDQGTDETYEASKKSLNYQTAEDANIQKLITYDKTIHESLKQVDKTYAVLKSALKTDDVMGTYAAGKELERVSFSAFEQIAHAYPSFDNEALDSVIGEISNSAEGYATAMQEAGKAVMNVANDDNKVASAYKFKSELQTASSSFIGVISNIAKAYELLGYKGKDIDLKNGGLLIPNKQGKGVNQDQTANTTKKTAINLSQHDDDSLQGGKYKAYGTCYNKAEKEKWTTIIVSSQIQKNDLIGLAKQLHANKPRMNYVIVATSPLDKKQWMSFWCNEDARASNDILSWASDHKIAIITRIVTDFAETDASWKLVLTDNESVRENFGDLREFKL